MELRTVSSQPGIHMPRFQQLCWRVQAVDGTPTCPTAASRSRRAPSSFIRSLAFRGGDDELQPSFDESLPPSKRTRPSYGLDADIPLPNFFPGPDAQVRRRSLH